ncbi:uncharacterized protein [Typha latifolia]|uniref:uncharacterized protein n=1 Tax=Typha latifolia TaxID=4733 RepID=UPI003C2D233C
MTMTSPPPSPPPPPPSSPAEILTYILHHLLPLLLSASLSVKTFVTRWRLLHSSLLLLRSSLSDPSLPSSLSHPLLHPLLPSLLSLLRSLLSLSSRCLDPSLPSGKLHLQSDLDVAASSLSLHLHDLSLLLRSGLLVHPPAADHQHAIVLPLPSASASDDDLSLFVRDLFARLQIGSLDLKLKGLDSLLDLLQSDPTKISPVVAAEGDVAAVLRFLDSSSHSLLRDRAAAAVSLLCTASEASRRAVFDEGGLGPLLRLLEAGSAAVRGRAAAAVEAIAADQASAWAIAAYGGVSALVNACRPGSGSASLQELAAASLRNVAAIDDVRAAMVEEGAIPVLVDLLTSGTVDAQKNSALCLYSLASTGGDEIRAAIVQEAGLLRLLQCLREASDQELQESTLKAIHAISSLPAAAKALCSSHPFFAHVTDLVRRGSVTAVALISDLSPDEDIKRSTAACMVSLVKMMETSKPATVQETAARALVSLLAVRSNRKELVRDEKSVMRLVQMLDPRNEEVCKRFPVLVVLALTSGGGNGCRKRLAEAGACNFLQKLADADVVGAKKALQRIAGSRLKNLFSMGWNS